MTETGAAPDWTEIGRKLFAGPCDFFFAAAKPDGLPPVGPPEIAFAGPLERRQVLAHQHADRTHRRSRAPRTRPAARRN